MEEMRVGECYTPVPFLDSRRILNKPPSRSPAGSPVQSPARIVNP